MTQTLTVEQAATFLGCNPETVRRMASKGTLPAAKLGRKWIFIEQDLAQYIRDQYAKKEAGVVQVDNSEESLCQSTNATHDGGLNLQHQTEVEYKDLLGLTTTDKRKNLKQS